MNSPFIQNDKSEKLSDHESCHPSLSVIKREHATLKSMLYSILKMIERGPLNEPELFFDTLRAMLFYIDEVPEKQHHPKETKFLFPLIAKRSKSCTVIIEKLNGEHLKIESTIRDLQHMLLGWEMLGDSRRSAFEIATFKYIDFYEKHMQLEESVIFPEASRVLNESECKYIDNAFAMNSDLLSFSKNRDPKYDRLFTKIMLQSPAPIGWRHTLGAASEST